MSDRGTAAEDRTLDEFGAWLVAGRAGEPVSAVAVEGWLADFRAQREDGRARRRDFFTRLLVCGIAHMATPFGCAPEDGRISRVFIPLFARSFGAVAAGDFGDDHNNRARALVEAAEGAGVEDADVWTHLLTDPRHSAAFGDLLAEILFKVARRPGFAERLRDRIADTGGDGLVGPYDVELVLAGWLLFARTAADAGIDFVGRHGPEVGDAVFRGLGDGIPAAARELYENVYAVRLHETAARIAAAARAAGGGA